MKIFCVECDKDVEAKIVTGSMVYPNNKRVAFDRFWMCNHCKNFVGCHKNANKNQLRPLGVIANKQLKSIRMQIHDIIDPIWREEKLKRGEVYALISQELGYQFHAGELRSIDEAKRVFEVVENINKNYV